MPAPTLLATLALGTALLTAPAYALSTCGNGTLDTGEDCDPSAASPADACPNAGNGLETCDPTNCVCACPGGLSIEMDADPARSEVDLGWTGIGHDAPFISGGKLTVEVLGCDQPTRSPTCGDCTFTGPVPNPGVGQGDIDNRRCTGDTSVRCDVDEHCGENGSCEFFLGPYLPISTAGVALCVLSEVAGTFTGTANVETGESTGTLPLAWRMFSGLESETPCPQCVGDPTPNDGLQGGTCVAGSRADLACDANGTSPAPAFGTTSFDCPPNPGSFLTFAPLPLPLTLSTGLQSRTLSEEQPNCQGIGVTGLKCHCDSCNHALALPCASNADCIAVGATICGGRRCISGPNHGTPCEMPSECPAGICSRPSSVTRPDSCSLGGACIPTADGEGVCPGGPKCFPGSGELGSAVTASGQADPPVADVSHLTLAALGCVGPSAAASVNAVHGFPGLARFTLGTTFRWLPDIAPLCGPLPREGCHQPAVAGATVLAIKDKTADERDRFTWDWKKAAGSATTPADFGSPETVTDYAFCLYDGADQLLLAATAPANGDCEGRPCWRTTRQGFRYVDRALTPDGVLAIDLGVGTDGRARLRVVAKGPALRTPALPLASFPLRAQLVSRDGACWEALSGTTRRNTAEELKAVSD